MTRTRIILILTVAAIAATVSLLGGVLREGSSAPPSALAAAQTVADFKAGFSLSGSTQSLVLQLQ